jgi:hypothetical protein
VDIFPKVDTMSTMAESKTKRRRRSYTDEFKASAVRVVLDEGRSVAGRLDFLFAAAVHSKNLACSAFEN